jgi:hypothetical protein
LADGIITLGLNKVKKWFPSDDLSSGLQTHPRAWLFFAVLTVELIASIISGVGFTTDNPAFLLSGTIIWMGWFILLFLMVVPNIDNFWHRHLTWMKRGAIALFILLLITGIAEAAGTLSLNSLFTLGQDGGKFRRSVQALEQSFQYNDATTLTHQAAENFIQGKNPYAKSNIVTAILANHISYDRVTPLRVGKLAAEFPYPENSQLAAIWQEALQDPQNPPVELETKYNYPSGSFMIPSIFLLAGIKDMRIAYFILVLAGCMYAFWKLPKNNRFIFAGAAIVSLEIWNSIGGGETGALVFPFLLLAWMLTNRHPWQSAIFMGLAIATKQTAWFFLPFYFIYMLKIHGVKRLLPFAGVITGIFAAFNLPFIVSDPGLWLNSLTAPVMDNMFPEGGGIVTLVISGLLNIQSSWIFAVIEILVFLTGIAWYWRNGSHYPYAGPILAIIPLFFAWRSLWTYFYYADLMVLAMLLMNGKHSNYDRLGRKTTEGLQRAE